MNRFRWQEGLIKMVGLWPFISLMVIFIGLPTDGRTVALADASPPSLAPMLERAVKSVVNISATGKAAEEIDPLLQDPFYRRFYGLSEVMPPQAFSFQSVGSGVIIDAQHGMVLTTYHVVEHADAITVTLNDGKTVEARLVGSDSETDLALIEIETEGLSAMPVGNSDGLKVGDYVVAIGNPFGLGQTATMGIISALGRPGLGNDNLEEFIQTDASINPGNSGGALVNLHGELIGINNATAGSALGISFATPSALAKRVADELAAHGKVNRGELGVVVQDMTPKLRLALKISRDPGVLVSQVKAGSAAQRSGMLAGDVITAIDGHPVKDASEFRRKISSLAPGSAIRLSIARSDKSLEITARLTDKESDHASEATTAFLDSIVLLDIKTEAKPIGQANGALVLAIDKDSRAAAAGLVEGDIIVSINRQAVHSSEETLDLARRSAHPLLLGIYRDNVIQFLAVE
ncbi:Do/DeqQ family serine protease [Phyllobacterium trifolii]|uniref:Do/DeqQ family serine protease n=1 Tax=Phyllobacterium trifolii TaxID=300193 RepID=A0A839U6Q5_9HYPH|nr:Do family serine endopeptidase [Phyllobacterium trifolii]MBB3146816.1 Do/DeqQ family serine protease [Phyllobacterium trifolii]